MFGYSSVGCLSRRGDGTGGGGSWGGGDFVPTITQTTRCPLGTFIPKRSKAKTLPTETKRVQIYPRGDVQCRCREGLLNRHNIVLWENVRRVGERWTELPGWGVEEQGGRKSLGASGKRWERGVGLYIFSEPERAELSFFVGVCGIGMSKGATASVIHEV